MAGYIRQDTTNNIANGNIINANDLDNEYDAIAAAFGAITGHKHDGTDAEGAPITKVGPVQDVVVSSTAVTPKTDNTVDLGSSSNEFKDLYIDGVANIDSLVADTADINGGTVDNTSVGATTPSTGAFTTLSSSSTTTLNGTSIPASKTLLVSTDIGVSVQGYDADLAAFALKTAPTGDVVGTSDAQTLTNKTLTSPVVSGGTINNASVGATTPSTGAFTTLSATGAVSLSGDTMTGPLVVNVNSTSDALKITQTGSGNALVVEDSANPDSTPFVIDSAGRVGIGTNSVDISASASLQLKGNTSELQIQSTNNTTSSPVAALSIMRYSAREGGLYLKDENALEVAFVGLPYRGGSPSQDLTFRTAGAERMRIDSEGAIYSGNKNTNANFTVGAPLVSRGGNTLAIGASVFGQATDSTLTSATGFETYINPSAGVSLTNLTHYGAVQRPFAGGVASNQYGFYSASSLTGASNNYGFYSAIASGTGRWNFYAAGTAANYFAGETTINSGLTIGRTAVTSPAASDGNVFSGTYTPTLTNSAGISSSTAYICQYMRVGDVVTVSGVLDITTSGTGSQTVGITLPIASGFTSIIQAAGTGTFYGATFRGTAAAIFADVTNDRATFNFASPSAASSQAAAFTFTYRVI